MPLPANIINNPTKRAGMIDRLILRPVGFTISGEVWHRDIAPPQYLPKDGGIEILGGWTNLDDTPQKFRCVPGSQLAPDGTLLDYRFLANQGFDKIPPHQHSIMEQNAVTITIPPGYHLLFHQHIVHTIYRMFQGFILSTSPTWNQYPFGGNAELLRMSSEWSVPMTPGGHKWAIYAQKHLM